MTDLKIHIYPIAKKSMGQYKCIENRIISIAGCYKKSGMNGYYAIFLYPSLFTTLAMTEEQFAT